MGPGALPPAPAVLLGPLLPALRPLPSTSRPFLNGTGIPSHQAGCSTIASVGRCLRVWLGLHCLWGTRSSLLGAAPALPCLLGSGPRGSGTQWGSHLCPVHVPRPALSGLTRSETQGWCGELCSPETPLGPLAVVGPARLVSGPGPRGGGQAEVGVPFAQ